MELATAVSTFEPVCALLTSYGLGAGGGEGVDLPIVRALLLWSLYPRAFVTRHGVHKNVLPPVKGAGDFARLFKAKTPANIAGAFVTSADARDNCCAFKFDKRVSEQLS